MSRKTAASKTGVTKAAARSPVAPRKAPARATGAAAKAADPVLVEGKRAPAFRIPRDDGSTVALKDFAGRKLVLFFYPRAGTPGCTIEANDFSRLAPQFERQGAAVLGVSADPQAALQRFRAKNNLKVALASDETLAMLEAYGVWAEKSLYGKTFMGVVRTTVLIDENGRVVRVWRNVKVPGHAEAVLSTIRDALS
ncbi:peroxiredoxin [Afipia carboxidovorans OM4]|nr:peroxiredoxin [Afipia carboxidovorans OM4]